MSSSTTDTIVYRPTPAEIRAAAMASLQGHVRRRAALVARAAHEARVWRDQAPETAALLDAFQVPTISGDADDPVAAAAAAQQTLVGVDLQLDRLVSLAAAEDARRRARAVVDAAEVAAARASADASVALPTIEIEDLGEAPTPAPSPVVPASRAPHAIPPKDERLDRVSTILERSAAGVEPTLVGQLLDDAVACADQVAFQTVLVRARRSVVEADTAAEARRRSCTEAQRLLASVGALEGPELDALRAHLSRAAAGSEPLDPQIPGQLAVAVRKATQQRFIDVVTSMGCELAPAQGDRLIGFIDQGDGTASRVVLDGQGVILTAVSSDPIDGQAAVALDQRNCDLRDELATRAAEVGVGLSMVSSRRPGELPVRHVPDLAAPARSTDNQRRRQRARRTDDQRSDQR